MMENSLLQDKLTNLLFLHIYCIILESFTWNLSLINRHHVHSLYTSATVLAIDRFWTHPLTNWMCKKKKEKRKGVGLECGPKLCGIFAWLLFSRAVTILCDSPAQLPNINNIHIWNTFYIYIYIFIKKTSKCLYFFSRHDVIAAFSGAFRVTVT